MFQMKGLSFLDHSVGRLGKQPLFFNFFVSFASMFQVSSSGNRLHKRRIKKKNGKTIKNRKESLRRIIIFFFCSYYGLWLKCYSIAGRIPSFHVTMSRECVIGPAYWCAALYASNWPLTLCFLHCLSVKPHHRVEQRLLKPETNKMNERQLMDNKVKTKDATIWRHVV